MASLQKRKEINKTKYRQSQNCVKTNEKLNNSKKEINDDDDDEAVVREDRDLLSEKLNEVISIDCNLPRLELFSSSTDTVTEDSDKRNSYPTIADLCFEDRLKISNLIDELSKSKQQNVEDTRTITDLQKEKFDLSMEITRMDKEITKLVVKCDQQEADIININKKYSKTVNEYKDKITEIKLQVDYKNKTLFNDLNNQLAQTCGLQFTIHELNRKSEQLTLKYKNAQKKLKQAVMLIKKLMKNSNKTIKNDKESRCCQCPSMTNCSSVNMNLESVMKENNDDPSTPHDPVPSQSNTELCLLSDLFFKDSNECDDIQVLSIFSRHNLPKDDC